MSPRFYLVILQDLDKGHSWLMEAPLVLSEDECAQRLAAGELSLDWKNETIERVLLVDTVAREATDVSAEIADAAAAYTHKKCFVPDDTVAEFLTRHGCPYWTDDDEPPARDDNRLTARQLGVGRGFSNW